MNEEQIKYYKLTKVTQRDLDEGVWDAEHKGLYSKDGKRFLLYKRPDEHIHSGEFDHFSFKPLFPETQNFQMLIDYLLEQNVNEKLINTIVEPIINVIQVE